MFREMISLTWWDPEREMREWSDEKERRVSLLAGFCLLYCFFHIIYIFTDLANIRGYDVALHLTNHV